MERENTSICAVFDTETRNEPRILRSLMVSAQISNGEVSQNQGCANPAASVNDTKLYRGIEPVYDCFDALISQYDGTDATPVVCVHNLAYDVYFIMEYIHDKVAQGYTVDCCFKTSIYPLTISLCRAGETVLRFWDTLAFAGKSLARMGVECGVAKAVGDWDYSLQRHAETPLTKEESYYAVQDTVVSFHWLAYWGALNPDIPLNKLGKNILTKTSVVRYKCKELAQVPGQYGSKTIYQGYLDCCKNETPKTEVDYALMIRSTSAGWTFIAGSSAGKAFENVCKFDATSMHPSHMVSHKYPYDFHVLDNATACAYVNKVFGMSYGDIVENWINPFQCGFNAQIKFTNLRPRHHSIYERDNLMLHGLALFQDYDETSEDDSQRSNQEFNAVNAAGYRNTAVNPVYSFGKLVSADSVVICLNELNAFVHAQVYEWDSYEIICASGTAKMRKPPEYVTLSVGTMLERKKVVKDAMHGVLPDAKPDWIPAHVWEDMRNAPHSDNVKQFYSQVKSDLNSLYGMFATNEAKRDIVYRDGTFVPDERRGFEKLPDKPKAWYNFGLRIAAWSRVQQLCAMELCSPVSAGYVNGDTDSFAFVASVENSQEKALECLLKPLHDSIEHSMRAIVGREIAGTQYDGLGFYMVDCEPDMYCAVANKRYAYTDTEGLHTASAGVPNKSVARAIEYELHRGCAFNEAVIRALGYNAGYGERLSGAKYKATPETFDECLNGDLEVYDYLDTPYTYPEGTQTGIYLAGTVKVLGAGCDDDYTAVCDNTGHPKESVRFYDLDERGEVFTYGG